jgi:hypothetical protein
MTEQIKTFDGAKLALQHWAARIENYPEGSLSKREIIATVPLDKPDEALFAKLNAKVTAKLVSMAHDAVKANGNKALKVVPREWLDQLTAEVRSCAQCL